MWHMIAVSADEQLELMYRVSRAVDRQAPKLAEHAARLAGTGVGLPAVRKETAEIYVVENDDQSKTLYLNDAALRFYQWFGGPKGVSGMVAEVPPRRPSDVFAPSRILQADVLTPI